MTSTRDEQKRDESESLAARWSALEEEVGRLRIRDAADRLGVSEAALLSTRLGDGVTRLDASAAELIESFSLLGEVMASTRNEWAVIEKHGTYNNIDIGDHVGLVLDHDIDLRLFMHQFHVAFFQSKMHRGEELHSIQFFDRSGTSLHKVYARDAASREAMGALVERFVHEDQASIFRGEPRPPREERADEEIDVEAFQKDWRELQDTHDFFGILRRHGVARLQAMRLAPEELVSRVATDAVDRVLEEAAARELSIMVFVGNHGCIEIHTGPVQRVVETGSWINVLDPTFNLHLNREGIASAWVVRKPTVDGIVTALELFDDRGETIAMLFGERKPGIPENEDWRELATRLEQNQLVWASRTCVGCVHPA